MIVLRYFVLHDERITGPSGESRNGAKAGLLVGPHRARVGRIGIDDDGLVALDDPDAGYEPGAGRFISRDPFPADALDTQTINRYVYVKNNPTNYVDPSGEVGTTPYPLNLFRLIQIIHYTGNRWYGQDDLSDAVRHAMTSKMVADEFGWEVAYFLGLKNEQPHYNDPTKKNQVDMDIWNNFVGIRAAKEGKPIDWRDLLILGDDGVPRHPTEAEYRIFLKIFGPINE